MATRRSLGFKTQLSKFVGAYQLEGDVIDEDSSRVKEDINVIKMPS